MEKDENEEDDDVTHESDEDEDDTEDSESETSSEKDDEPGLETKDVNIVDQFASARPPVRKPSINKLGGISRAQILENVKKNLNICFFFIFK